MTKPEKSSRLAPIRTTQAEFDKRAARRSANNPQPVDSLRDVYASAALEALLKHKTFDDELGREAFRIADRMLALREAPSDVVVAPEALDPVPTAK